ncbi:BQ5605_C016g08115 [Microbotryum silenes-dioicae]|uniref:Alpha-1,3-glucosyltransferase n=1 Tax=Microbotryum silenes-dioicae TaxID=796604 RepID=A0A2X0LV98_9BASI|nr:BQ5605_C016g08115 [Microbotryum silenes-dioicae]
MSTRSRKSRAPRDLPPPLPPTPSHFKAESNTGTGMNMNGSKSPVSSPPPGNVQGQRWWRLSSSERDVLLVSLLVKLLLFPAYRSTDFEVHRNWVHSVRLAITHSLPLSKWYYDTTSIWTLDYPPLFAYFERFLAFFAYIVDPQIVRLDNLEYAAWSVVAFQRTTVVLSELVLATALLMWSRRSKKPDHTTAFLIAASVLLHPGLIIVDHIHFQYNGFLLGILLWSVVAARENNLYLSAALFAVLLNFKHIFIYLAPPYFVFLLRRHCFSSGRQYCALIGFLSDRLVELGALVTAVFAVSFGPFLLAGGPSAIRQIFSRLFPFQRGLNHAYWAGNVWAIVSTVDRVLVKYLLKRGWPISPDAIASASRGIVGETTFGVLPTVTPGLCFTITLSFSMIYLAKLWVDPTYKRFLDSLVLSAFTSFLWGWHVHEKAVLLFLVPLSLTAAEDEHHLRAFIVATTAGVYSLFPLLIKPNETPVKVLYSLLWAAIVFPAVRKVVYRPLPNLMSVLIHYGELLYLAGFAVLHLCNAPSASSAAAQIVTSLPTHIVNGTAMLCGSPGGPACAAEPLAKVAAESTMEFLPLMLTSLYCSVGIIWAWLRLSVIYLWT